MRRYTACSLRKVLLYSIAATISVLIAAVQPRNSYSQSPRLEQAPRGFVLRIRSYNYISEVEIQAADTRDTLWHLEYNTNYAKDPPRFGRFDYGKPPMNMHEIVPPKRLRLGDKITLRVTYQYDTCVSPCVTRLYGEYIVVAPNRFFKARPK
jgi:hypothetical protein